MNVLVFSAMRCRCWVIAAALIALCGITAGTAHAQCGEQWVGMPEQDPTGVNFSVSALATLPSGDLIAGGGFTTAGGVSASRIARWNGTSWSPLGLGLNGGVQALAVLPNGDLVASGSFTTADGGPVNRNARWNGTSWAPLGTGMNDAPYALAVLPNGDLVAGGEFTSPGVAYVARWSGASWVPMGPGTDYPVYALAVMPNGDVVAGGYDDVQPGQLTLNNITRWNGTSWTPLGWMGPVSPGTFVAALTVMPNGDLVAGGSFETAGGVAALNIARWNGSTWAPLGSGTNGFVKSLTVLPNGDLIAGGSFETAGGVAALNIARWNGSTWAPLGSGFSGSFSEVRSLAVLPTSDLVAGGSFTTAGGVTVNRIARWPADTDGDGLLDCWEIHGLDINNDGTIDLDLPAMGAQPNRKDIFVEIDAMVGRAPTMADLQPVINAFDQAPVAAPPGGGQGGIALHLLIDEVTIPLASFPNDFTDFDVVKATRFGTAAERANANWPFIKAAREKAFRYCIFADTYGGTGSSGLAEFPGNDFMVTLGAWNTPGGTPDEKAGTFMHELGHTLGLDHGGGDGTHYKPNYYSVMNYRWQTPQSNYPHLWRLDYSREPLPSLDETMLDESVSLGATRPEYNTVRVPFTTTANTWGWARLTTGHMVDWNGDGATPAGQPPVDADINREEPTDAPGTLTTLTGHDDWANLRYALTGHVNFGNGRTETTIDDEFDLTEFAINEQIPPPPALCAADTNDDGSLDFFDVQQFLNWYAAGDDRADFIDDDQLDFFDVQAFLNAYAAGCP